MPRQQDLTITEPTKLGSTNPVIPNARPHSYIWFRGEPVKAHTIFVPTTHISLYCRNPRGTEPATASAGTRRKPGGFSSSPQLPAANRCGRPTRVAVDSAVLLQHAAPALRGRTGPSAPGKQIQYFTSEGYINSGQVQEHAARLIQF